MNNVEEITRLLREMNAAKNRYMRASGAFVAAIPPDTVILHRYPGEPDGPETIYWAYFGEPNPGMGVRKGNNQPQRAIIVEAPVPAEECGEIVHDNDELLAAAEGVMGIDTYEEWLQSRERFTRLGKAIDMRHKVESP